MPTIKRTPESLQDYRDIWQFIARDNIEAANRMLDQIDAKLESFLSMPQSGTPRDEFSPGLRSFPVGNYIVFYRPVEDGIALLRVFN